MNQLIAEITAIQSSDDLLLVQLACEGLTFFSLIISNEEDYIWLGNKVFLVFKETEVAVALPPVKNISIRNHFPATLENMDKGKILSELKLNFKGHSLKSIITTASCELLDLKINDQVTALVKTNEVMLMKI